MRFGREGSGMRWQQESMSVAGELSALASLFYTNFGLQLFFVYI